jgi:hypothetical protein
LFQCTTSAHENKPTIDLIGLTLDKAHLKFDTNTISTLHRKMAPTEQEILSNYLLAPARLPSIISLQEFIALFPRQLQSSPQVRSLYRDLQSQRNALVDAVAEQVEEEAKHGKAMRRAFIRSKREAEAQEHDDEVEIERMVSLHQPSSSRQ